MWQLQPMARKRRSRNANRCLAGRKGSKADRPAPQEGTLADRLIGVSKEEPQLWLLLPWLLPWQDCTAWDESPEHTSK